MFRIAQRRLLNLHEYQSMGIFEKFHVPVPRGRFARTADEARSAATVLGGDVVIKAQVLAGGRGMGKFKENSFQGGVHMAKSPKEAKEIAAKMIGKTLVTKQTGEAGRPCNGVFVVEKVEIAKEMYFAILMDRASGGPMLVASSKGGMNIEDVAHSHPEAIERLAVDIKRGLSATQARELAEKIGFSEAALDQASECLLGLYKTFIDADCTMVEINPLAELKDGRVLVCDAKVNFDDNADFRQKEIHAMRDFSQEDPREVEAHKSNLNYIGLDGSVGCMVNGAGLAMATMDILSLFKGFPANFLDVGGSAQAEQIKNAFGILEKDPKVKSILVNIFGGIMRCDIVAEGIVAASKELSMKKPIVIRLVGTNVEKGKDIIKKSGLKLAAFDDLNEAAKEAVRLSTN